MRSASLRSKCSTRSSTTLGIFTAIEQDTKENQKLIAIQNENRPRAPWFSFVVTVAAYGGFASSHARACVRSPGREESTAAWRRPWAGKRYATRSEDSGHIAT